MPASFSITTLPLTKGQWNKEARDHQIQQQQAVAALLQAHGTVELSGDCDPIARLVLRDTTVHAIGRHGGFVTVPVLLDMEQAVQSALDATLANQIFLAQGHTHRCVLGNNEIAVLVQERPYASLTIPPNAQASVLGIMPSWSIAIGGKPTKMEAYFGPTIVDQILKRLKKDQPHIVLQHTETGEWYVDYDVTPTSTTLMMSPTPSKAKRWKKLDDAVLHALVLEGLHTQNFFQQPTATGWANAGQNNRDSGMTVHRPLPHQPFAAYSYAPLSGHTAPLMDAQTFERIALVRRHHELVGINPYGAPACAVLRSVAQDAPAIDQWIALNDASHAAPVAATLESLGVPTRKNPQVVLAQRACPHYTHQPTIWSLALPQHVADAFLAQASSWPNVVIAHQPWSTMWP